MIKIKKAIYVSLIVLGMGVNVSYAKAANFDGLSSAQKIQTIANELKAADPLLNNKTAQLEAMQELLSGDLYQCTCTRGDGTPGHRIPSHGVSVCVAPCSN